MNKSLFIVISIVLVIQLLMLVSLFRLCPVAKAGKVSKFCWKYKLLYANVPTSLDCNGKSVDASTYKVLYVSGNSMKDSDIFDGDQIYVLPFESEDQKETIKEYPVLVFNIYNMKYQSKYKLRKFVCYITEPLETDWEKIYKSVKRRIKIGKEEFLAEMKVKQGNLTNPQEKHILSETFDEDNKAYHYSLHPISSLYGKAMYTYGK